MTPQKSSAEFNPDSTQEYLLVKVGGAADGQVLTSTSEQRNGGSYYVKILLISKFEKFALHNVVSSNFLFGAHNTFENNFQVHTQTYNGNDEGQYFQITKQNTDCYKLKVLYGNGILLLSRH